ncbi:hypothetical protein [Hydrocarboniphaga effusa]|uniref:hypothetical protein n=1 Tax=Hydrocarboniphaga effusa TaxID=243629 RepID=UPI0031377FA6
MAAQLVLRTVEDCKFEVMEHSRNRAHIDPDDLVFYINLGATRLGVDALSQQLHFSPEKGFNAELLDGRIGTVLGMSVMTERSPEVPDEVRERYRWCVYEVREPANVYGEAVDGSLPL